MGYRMWLQDCITLANRYYHPGPLRRLLPDVLQPLQGRRADRQDGLQDMEFH